MLPPRTWRGLRGRMRDVGVVATVPVDGTGEDGVAGIEVGRVKRPYVYGDDERGMVRVDMRSGVLTVAGRWFSATSKSRASSSLCLWAPLSLCPMALEPCAESPAIGDALRLRLTSLELESGDTSREDSRRSGDGGRDSSIWVLLRRNARYGPGGMTPCRGVCVVVMAVAHSIVSFTAQRTPYSFCVVSCDAARRSCVTLSVLVRARYSLSQSIPADSAHGCALMSERGR